MSPELDPLQRKQGKGGYYYPCLVKALKKLPKLNGLNIKLEGMTIFYPGSLNDYTLNKALNGSTKIINNDVQMNKEFMKKYNGVKGDCLEVYKTIDYDVLFLNHVQVLNKNLCNRTSKSIITCRQGHYQHKEFLSSWNLSGVLKIEGNKIVLDTRSLDDYDTFPPDDEIRETELFKFHYENTLRKLRDKKEVNNGLLEELLEDIKTDYNKIHRLIILFEIKETFLYKDFQPVLEKIDEDFSTEELGLIFNLMNLEKEKAIDYINEIKEIKSFNKEETLKKADKQALHKYKQFSGGPDYKKNGFLYIYLPAFK